MVEVSVEVLGGVAVTILLMLVFLGVVVMWDIALALRDVAEKIDSLEDDVDSDLDTIDGTLTRIHDSMREQARTNGGMAGTAGVGATAEGRGSVAEPDSRPGGTDRQPVATPGVGTPTAPSGQSTVGGLQAAQPAPEGVVGQVQLANGRQGRRGTDATGASTGAAATDGDTSAGVDARSVSVDEFGSDTQGGDGPAADDVATTDGDEADGSDSTDGDEDDATEVDDATEEAGSHDEDPAGAEDDTGGEPEDAGVDGEDGGVDESDDDTGPESDDAPEGPTDDDDLPADDGPPADEDVPVAGAEDGTGDDEGGAEDATPAGERADDGPDAEAVGGESEPAGDGGTDAAADEPLDGSVAQLLDDADEPDDEVIEPDDSATEAVRNFGRDARTNRGLGPSPEFFSDADRDAPDGATAASTADTHPAAGRFATEDGDEPWYATRFESHPRTTGAIAETSGASASSQEPDAEPAPPASADEPARSAPEFGGDDVGMDDLVAGDADGPRTGPGDAPESGDGQDGDDSTDGDGTDASSGGDDPERTAAESEPPTGDDETESDGSTLADLVDDADAEGAAAAVLQDADAGHADVDDGDGDVAGDATEPMDVGDLVEQELTTLTQAVGGTSISPDVSAMPLVEGAAELDDTEYTFPLSGESYGLAADTENEVARLELVPDGDAELGGASEQLLRYQFRSYLDQEESTHAELSVGDDGVVVVEIPGATADSLDAWADALIQITDRTLYLARSEE